MIKWLNCWSMGWNCETLQIPNIIFRQLPSDSPLQASLVLERSLQIAQSEHIPSVKRQLSMSTSHPFGKGGKPWTAGMQIALSLPFTEAKTTEKCGKFEKPLLCKSLTSSTGMAMAFNATEKRWAEANKVGWRRWTTLKACRMPLDM